MARFDWSVVQGSPEWFRMHCTIPTASEFDKILTPKKCELAAARFKYACRIVAARVMNWQPDSLDKVEHILAGKENEPLAAAQLALLEDIELRTIGFVRTNDGRFGASPDRVAGVSAAMDRVDATVELKCPTIPTQIEYLLLGHAEAYRCQVQGQLYVAEADKAIFYSYNPRMPAYHVETGRDEPFIRKLADALEQFSDELEALTEKAKSLGVYQAFETIAPPVEAERGDDIRDLEPAGVIVERVLSGDRAALTGWGF